MKSVAAVKYLQSDHRIRTESIDRVQPKVTIEVLGVEARQRKAISIASLSIQQHDTNDVG